MGEELICFGLFLLALVLGPSIAILVSLSRAKAEQRDAARDLARQIHGLQRGLLNTQQLIDQVLSQRSGDGKEEVPP
ncbi:MAG TPA: hypothetical protein VLA12_03045, partial [Planctomycetaceae bacterium]|nr:hypothetical protein [Planctomycetaceae bacterium]